MIDLSSLVRLTGFIIELNLMVTSPRSETDSIKAVQLSKISDDTGGTTTSTGL